EAREMEAQVLDSNPIERERGITIKAQSVSLPYTAKSGQVYQLNFIDTPGHVDFSYEVSRSLAACEGALLVVDAGQGVEAQSVANCYTAIEQGLEGLPVINNNDRPPGKTRRAHPREDGPRRRRAARAHRGAHPAAAWQRASAAAGADHRLLVR